MEHPSENSRLLGDLIRYGTVVEVGGAHCRVLIDDEFETDWIRMPMLRAGKTRIWSPLSEGEQVVLACPEGDIAAAAVIASISSDDFPPPADDGRTLIVFDDDCQVSYDPDAHRLVAELPAGGLVDITATGGITLTGPVKIIGDVAIEGEAKATGDFVAGDISLQGHVHDQVKFGTDRSGKAVA